jgi:2-dehydro-3-deoxyphosphogluconate aldolase/(4S)-4-hydroxy-2-oxoglutarate aldolase
MTMRSDAAPDALKAMKDAAPELIVGMGTIRNTGDIETSRTCGADFLVSPGAGPALLSALAGSGMPALPGVATASEAMTAQEAGFGAMKFFPAEPAGGVALLKALGGPLPDIIFCPTGGISAEKAPDYLALPNVACVGGAWIATKRLIREGAWSAIEENARRAVSMRG